MLLLSQVRWHDRQTLCSPLGCSLPACAGGASGQLLQGTGQSGGGDVPACSPRRWFVSQGLRLSSAGTAAEEDGLQDWRPQLSGEQGAVLAPERTSED